MNNNKLTHREFCFKVADAKNTTFIEVNLGSPFLQAYCNDYGKVPITDVITIKPSYNKFCLDIYECKVSRADFLKDIKTKKYESYYPHCNRFYYACYGDIIKKEELPEGVGLLKYGEKGFSTIKATKLEHKQIPEHTLLSILFFKGRILNPRRKKIGVTEDHKLYSTYRNNFPGLDKRIKEALVNYNDLELKFKNLLWSASRLIDDPEEREKFLDIWENKSYIQ